MIEVEKIIQREDRKASRKDRKSVGGKKIAFAGEGTHHSNDDTQYAYIWDTSVNDGYGGFIMTAKRVREDIDEEEDRQTKHRPDAIQEISTETGTSRGIGAKGAEGKRLNPADRKCFICGQEGHCKAQCSQIWYVPKSVLSSWWKILPFLYGKGKGKANGKGEERAPGGSAKAKTKATVLGCTVRSLLTGWKDAT